MTTTGKIALFVGGTLFGSYGFKLLGSKDAKKVYTHCTAAVLRAKDSVVKTATAIQENGEDILAEAKKINDERVAEEEEAVVEDIDEETESEKENGAE